MSGAKHGEVLVAWPGSSAPVHQPASLVGAGHPVFSIHRRDIIHGQPITGDKPFTNTSDLLGNACIVEPLLDHFFNDDASHQKLIEFLKGCAERAHEAGAVVLLIYRKANRHGRMPLVGASGSQAPIQIYFVNWGMKALQFSRERKYAKLTIYDGGWAEDAASTSGPKTYSAVAASSGASAVAAAPAARPPVVETGGWAEWVNRGVQGVNRGVQAVKTAIVGLDFDLAKKLEPLVNISTSWTADPNVFANVTKLLGEFDRHVQATLASTTYLPHLSSELINVADLLEKYRTDSFLSDPCFTLLVCELYWNYCAAAKGFQVYVSEPAKARIRVLVRRSIDAYTICENPSELDIFRSEKFEAIVIYRSNPTQELSWMCKHIISCGILDMSGKSLLTMVWIHACCRRQAPELLKDHNFLRTWSDKMLQSDRDYTLDFGLVNAFTEAFGSAPQAHQLFFSIVANANEFLRVWGIMSCAGPVFVEDELLRRVMEGETLSNMTQLLANFASDAQRCKLIANKMVETAAREDNGWRDLAKECSAVSADAAVAELQASVGRWIMSPKFRARGSVLSLTVLLQCGPLGAGIDAATLQKFLSTAQRRDRGDRPMRLQGSLAEWLTLLDELAKRSETFHPSIVFQMRCYVDEMQPRKGSETLSIFSEILSGLMLHPPDFAKEENELTRNIATELMQSSEHHNLIPHLRLQASLCDLKLGGKGDACALHMMLVSRLITKIADSDPAGRSVIESAIQCFRRANAAVRKQQFAATLLVEHCSRWWPSPDERSAAKDLLCSNRLQDITYVAQQVSHFRGASNDDALVAGKVAELLDPLRAICIELVQKVAEERVCRCELDDIKRKLDLLGGLTRTLQLSDFPTRTKLDELRCAFDEINTALLSQLRLSSLSFLAPEESTFNIALSDLLSKRAVRLPPSVHNLLEENALTDDSSSFKIETRDKELCALRISRTELEAWRRPLEVILRQLAYLQVHKSSLFEHYLSKQREDDEKSSLWEWDEFLAAMETAKMSLLRLGNEQEAHFADLKEAAERMKGAPEKELRVIERIPGLADGRHVSLDGIRVILDLVRFAEPVKGLVNFLEQYRGFSCVESDPNFEALKRMADQINDSSAMDGVTASACRDLSKRLNGLLGALAEDLDDELKSDLQLFTELSRSASVWNFVKDNEFYAAEGLRRFGDEYENVTNLLQGEVYETAVLDQLDLAVRYISVMMTHQSTSQTVASLLREVRFSKVCEKGRETGFRELFEIQQNISRIEHWFSRGLGDMEAIFDQFKALHGAGKYRFHPTGDALSYELCLSYTITMQHQQQEVELRPQELKDLVSRLSFVQHDEKAKGLPVAQFLAEYQQYNNAASIMQELADLGNAKYLEAQSERRVLGDMLSFVVSFTRNVADELAKWKTLLAEQRASYRLLALFTTAEARRLADLLGHARVQPDVSLSVFNDAVNVEGIDEDEAEGEEKNDEKQRERRKYEEKDEDDDEDDDDDGDDDYDDDKDEEEVQEKDEDAIASIVQIVVRLTQREASANSEAVRIALSNSPVSASCWPEAVGLFLAEWYRALGEPPLPVRPLRALRATSAGIYVHALDSVAGSRMLQLLAHIFHGRLPESFEVFDCQHKASHRELTQFLERTQHFHDRTFALLRVDRLAVSLQEIILKFVLARKNDDEPVRLHCVQALETILQPAPWIHFKQWDARATELKPLDEARAYYKRLVVDGRDVSSVTLLTSDHPGMGKTHMARKRLAERREHGMPAFVFSITEDFDPCDMAERLQHIDNSDRGTALFFQINIGVYGHDEEVARRDLMSRVNHFFFSLLVLRSIENASSGVTYNVPSGKSWHIDIEVPSNAADWPEASEQLLQDLPLLAFVGETIHPRPEYDINDDTRRVCKYLRAYRDGTINRKFGGGVAVEKQVIFVLDTSGSMRGNPLNMAVDNMLHIFETHVHEHDAVSLVRFDHRTFEEIPIQVRGAETAQLKARFEAVRHIEDMGGTAMYAALATAIRQATSAGFDKEAWIICLTDGCSTDKPDAVLQQLRVLPNVHIIIIGIGLPGRVLPTVRDVCKARDDSKGQYIPAGGLDALNEAFATAASLLPVSQTFDLDGDLSGDECRALMTHYMPETARRSILLQHYWVQYLHRRVKIFDESHDFNYNQTHEELGGTLMTTMLSEVERALNDEHRRKWKSEDHQQLIYDFSHEGGPRFGLISTAPELMDPGVRAAYEALEFEIPTSVELRDRNRLDDYLARALGIALDKNGRVAALDEQGFVITLDFLLKLLNIHERVACRIPCLMEGETGVSKTALTKMYAILVNTAARSELEAAIESGLQEIVDEVDDAHSSSISSMLASTPVEKLSAALADTNVDELTTGIVELLQRLPMLETPDNELVRCARDPDETPEDRMESTGKLLQWIAGTPIVQTYFQIDVHAALTVADVLTKFGPVRENASRVDGGGGTITIFLDEVNTASCMGLFKEIVIDHSICGERLPANVVVIAACNPARSLVVARGGVIRHDDLGKDWALGHYQVRDLPGSMHLIKWNFGSLGPEQEKEFVQRRLEMFASEADEYDRDAMTDLVTAAQEMMRQFATEHIRSRLDRHQHDLPASERMPRDELNQNAADRASSVVSLRDIQRVFSLLNFFSGLDGVVCGLDDAARRSLLLTVAVVYYLRLSPEYRTQFVETISKMPSEQYAQLKLLPVLEKAMDFILDHSDIPAGIARTTGLKENVFMTLICALSRTPLVIIGPPGSSKTLSVNTVVGNANGEESCGPFYRNHPRLEPFHYQCSRLSTSLEIESVFKRAIERQGRYDHSQLQTLVFMDEAGLPEEEQESLKVLHYYLEGHMSTRAAVSFIAISNHVLDAAKSNRCVCLLRAEPDNDELRSIANGCILDRYDDSKRATLVAGLPPSLEVSVGHLIDGLCQVYKDLLNDDARFAWFKQFYGLRDFIHALKLLRRLSRDTAVSLEITVHALERNFNGTTNSDEDPRYRLVLERFLGGIFGRDVAERVVAQDYLRQTVDVLRSALGDTSTGDDSSMDQNAPRYKLIIDESDDDSMLRLLQQHGFVDFERRGAEVFKLSDFPENDEIQKVSLVSGVKLAALRGDLAVLSQTESVNESFYDLFNQHFKQQTTADGVTRHFANIAVGAMSKPCLVHPNFQCLVHVRASELPHIPAPFLNRFEKYRLSQVDLLRAGLSSMSNRQDEGLARLLDAAVKKVRELVQLMGTKSFYGSVDGQTLESVFVDMLPRAGVSSSDATAHTGSTGAVYQNVLLSTAHTYLHGQLVLRACTGIGEDNLLEAVSAQLPSLRAHLNSTMPLNEPTNGLSISLSQLSERGVAEPRAQLIGASLYHLLVHSAVARLLQLATPEAVYCFKGRLPKSLMRVYFETEHFSLQRLIRRVCSDGAGKHLVYTRTTPAVHRLPNRTPDTDLSAEARKYLQSAVHTRADEIALIYRLAQFSSEDAFQTMLSEWTSDDKHRLLLLVVDMNVISITRVNFVRLKFEQLHTQPHKSVVMLLHFPLSDAHVRACYPALFLAGWEHTFLDAVGQSDDGPASLEIKKMLQVACDLDDSFDPTHALHASLEYAMHIVASRISFTGTDMSFPDKQRKLLQLIRTASAEGDCTVADCLCKRYASLWDVERIKEELGSSAHASFDGAQQLSMVEGISNLFLSSFVNYLAWAVAKLLRDTNPERLNTSSILQFFWGMLERMDIRPLHELKLLNPVWNVALPDTAEIFPFFALISSGIDELVEAAIQEKAPELDDLQQVRKWQAQELVEVAEAVQAKLSDDPEKGANELLRWAEEQSHDAVIWSAYLDHYIATKLGGPQSTVSLSLKAWLLSRIPKEISKISLSLLHLMVRKHHLELSTLAMSLRPTATLSRAIEDVEFSLKPDEFVVSIVEAFAVALTRALPAEAKLAVWLQAFEELVEWLQTIELRDTVKADQIVRLTHQLDELSTLSAAARALPNDQTARMLETLRQGERGMGLRVALEVVGANLTCRMVNISFVTTVLRWYCSPWRMRQQVMDIDEIEPFLSLIAHDQIPRGHAVSLLRLLLQHYGSDSQERHAALGYSMAVMKRIGRRLSPEMIYAPPWLLQGRESSSESDSIANVLFAVIAKKTFDDRSETDCAQLATQVQQAAVRAARMRTHDPLVAPIDTIVLVVDRMALVARLAADFADEQAHPGQTDALRGTDAQRIIRALDDFVEDERFQWREFFFDCISRRAGTAKVHELLTAPQSRLASSDFRWCDDWRLAVPRHQEGESSELASQQQKVADLQRSFRDEQLDEQRKGRDCRLCPQCNRIVEHIADCSSMICGRDAHSVQGVAQNQQHGCGAAFDWGHAQRYMPNVEDARRRVEQAVQDLERVEGTVAAAAEKWERLREFAKTVEPIIDLDRTIPEPIVHRMSLMDELRRQPERNSPLAHFFQLRPSLRRLHVLPDLIELYQWLHLNLEHLLTKKRALDLPVGVLFNKEKLSARFSKSHVGHIIALWTRAKKGFNQFAAGMGYQIGAGACDAANPLEPITDETPVLRLLTDDQDETAGNDDLFRAIKKMIEIYNDFVQRTENEGTVRTEILPASITRSNIMMGDRMPFERTLSDEETSSYFEDLVDCYWHDGKFDLTTLKDDINDLFLRRSPRISDPNKTLRKVFSFRAVSDDRTAGESKITGHGDSGSIVESIREALQSMEITESRGLAATLLATYHTASYRLLSDMLVGLKVVVDVAVQQRDPKAGVKAVLRLISPDANDNDGLLKPVNMHEADGSQQEFLLRASLPDSLAIAYFVHKQLAVEAFSYAHHPLSVKMPLHDRIKQSLITNLKKVPRLPEQLQELVNSLAHAEHDMLRNHESTKPIRDYLVATMGYEPSDRLIAALGEDVCVQHYVELRQTLHQLAVEHASLPPASDSDELQINWRWTTGVVPGLLDEAETQVDDEEVFHERPPPRRLWFESEDDFAHGVEESKLEDDDTQHADKCVCLQRAWRNYYRRQGGGGSSRRRAKALWQRVRSDILQRMREGLPPLLDDHNIAAVADEMPASAPILNDAEIVSPRSTLVAIAMIIVVGMSIWYHFFGLIVKSCLVAGFILGATVWVRKHAEDALNTARAVPRVYWTGMICVVAVVAVFRATSLYFPHRPSELPQHFATHQQQPSEQQQPLESIDPMLVEWVREQKLPDTFVSSLNDYGVRYKDDLLELDAEDISTLKETLQRFDQKRLDKCLAQLQSWEGDSLAQLQSLEDGSELKSLQGSEREGDNTEGTRSDVPVCDNNDFRDGSGACTHQPPN